MFSKRMSRRVYWIGVAILIAVTAILISLPTENTPGGAISVIWLLLWASRLRDIGQSPWYCLLSLAVQVVVLLLGFAAGGENFGKILVGEVEGIRDDDPAVQAAYMVYVGVILVHFIFTGWLGSVPGDTGPNRYGEPPKT